MKNKFILGFVLALICVCAMAASLARYEIYTPGTTLIQQGFCISSADGTVTNTFPIVYGAIPQVFLTQLGATNNGSNYITSLNTTNFVVKVGLNAANTSNSWMSIGSP